MPLFFCRRQRNARIFFKIEEGENLTRRNTVCISRTKVTAGEAEVAAHNLSMTKRLEKTTFSGQALIRDLKSDARALINPAG